MIYTEWEAQSSGEEDKGCDSAKCFVKPSDQASAEGFADVEDFYRSSFSWEGSSKDVDRGLLQDLQDISSIMMKWLM